MPSIYQNQNSLQFIKRDVSLENGFMVQSAGLVLIGKQ
jgi:hypothetical protein